MGSFVYLIFQLTTAASPVSVKENNAQAFFRVFMINDGGDEDNDGKVSVAYSRLSSPEFYS